MEEENRAQEERKGIPAFASIVIYLVMFLLLGGVLTLCLELMDSVKEVNSTGLSQELVMSLVTFVSGLLPALFLLRFLDHRPFSDLGFSLAGRGRDLLYGLLAAVVLYGIGFGLSLALGAVEVVGYRFDPVELSVTFLLFILVALTEELMVRGYILGRLLRTRMNRFLALFISSVLFSCLHLFNPNVALMPILNLALAGMLLGAAYLYTRNLWFPISLHLFWNWLQGPVLGYEVSGSQIGVPLLKLHLSGNTLVSGGAFGFEGSILCTLLTAALTGAIIWWFERKR